MDKIEIGNGVIYNADALDFLKSIPDNSVDTVVTSPPYNKTFLFGKKTHTEKDTWRQRNVDYDAYNDDMEWDKYVAWQKQLLSEMIRVIKPTGSIFYNHKFQILNHKPYFPEWVFDFNVRQLIIWDRGGSPQIAPIRWIPSTEYVFWITKSNIQPKFYRRGKFKTEVWRIFPKPNPDHPAPFPEQLVAECVINTTDEGDFVIDPFLGSGTTAIVSEKLNRKWAGADISERYCQIVVSKIKKHTRRLSLL